VDPSVGIDPFHLGNDAFQLDGLISIEFRGKGVMRLDL
jgi:hypothetical protein